ncbi:amidohydrolase family protein [Naumannella sp. ID2617S]|uniref:amidohydrolase family protein n=1 Tax=Enemella dayhoffiae TaxID=2016507 RepID=UPI001488E917|nr:amidohydrolase family protein [Enemella dayhoffiae]NNG20166.1 amidohydrolase family protein [Naumannella sp. ID2617S]
MIDNHCHVFTHAGIRPPVPVGGAAYEPPQVGVHDHADHLAALGCDRGVLVQPSAYGTDDHDILLAALRQRPEQLRGVACVPVGTPPGVLEAMHQAGVRATRVQDGYPGGVPVEAIGEVAAMVAPFGWHIEVWSDLRRHVDWFADRVRRCGAEVVVDHLGHLPSDQGLDTPAVRMLLDLVRDGQVWVTLSGLDRLLPAGEPGQADPDFASRWRAHEERVDERVAALVDAGIERVLWGSDWPHVGLTLPHPGPDTLLGRLHRWLPEEGQRQVVTGLNPSRRYDFPVHQNQ